MAMVEWWDQFYRENPMAFGEEPTPIVRKALTYIHPAFNRGRAMDIGSGPGRNAVFLAERAFTVDAVDPSKQALMILRQRAVTRNVRVNTWAEDATSRKIIKGHYQMIICVYVLHEFSYYEGIRVIQMMQEEVALGGLNVIAAWMTEGDLWDEPGAPDQCFFDSKELTALWYGDENWKIEEYAEEDRKLWRKGYGGKELYNRCAYLIARRAGGIIFP